MNDGGKRYVVSLDRKAKITLYINIRSNTLYQETKTHYRNKLCNDKWKHNIQFQDQSRPFFYEKKQSTISRIIWEIGNGILVSSLFCVVFLFSFMFFSFYNNRSLY